MVSVADGLLERVTSIGADLAALLAGLPGVHSVRVAPPPVLGAGELADAAERLPAAWAAATSEHAGVPT